MRIITLFICLFVPSILFAQTTEKKKYKKIKADTVYIDSSWSILHGKYGALMGSDSYFETNIAESEELVYIGELEKDATIKLAKYEQFEAWTPSDPNEFTGTYRFFNESLVELDRYKICKSNSLFEMILEPHSTAYNNLFLVKEKRNHKQDKDWVWYWNWSKNYRERGIETHFKEKFKKDPKMVLKNYTIEQKMVEGKLGLAKPKSTDYIMEFVKFKNSGSKESKGLIFKITLPDNKKQIVLFMVKS